jgi:hypothetical protein
MRSMLLETLMCFLVVALGVQSTGVSPPDVCGSSKVKKNRRLAAVARIALMNRVHTQPTGSAVGARAAALADPHRPGLRRPVNRTMFAVLFAPPQVVNGRDRNGGQALIAGISGIRLGAVEKAPDGSTPDSP